MSGGTGTGHAERVHATGQEGPCNPKMLDVQLSRNAEGATLVYDLGNPFHTDREVMTDEIYFSEAWQIFRNRWPADLYEATPFELFMGIRSLGKEEQDHQVKVCLGLMNMYDSKLEHQEWGII